MSRHVSVLGRFVRSVRFRITAIAAVVVAVVLLGVGALLLTVQHRQLTDNLDASLGRRADVLAGVAAELAAAPPATPVVLASGAGDDSVLQIATADGRVVAATANAVSAPSIGPVPEGERDVIRTVDVLPVEDDRYRVLSRLVPDERGDLVIHVAENTDDGRELDARLRNAIALAVPIAVLVLVALVWRLVGRTLRPVEAIRSEVAGIGPDQLDRRVSQPGTGDEIDRLATTMNEMIERLESATARLRRFVADASHELRSPLARMRTELEVEMNAPPERRRPVEDTYRSVIEEVDALAALVDDLLTLARSDADRMVIDRRRIDLDDIVLDEVNRARATGTVTIDRSGVSAALVDGDPGELRRVVRNLLDNAVRHAESRVTVTLRDVGGEAVLVVADDGQGIPAADAAAVFDRFTRLDSARSRATGGTGLGLAIARAVVERHGGTISVDTATPGTDTMTDTGSGARFVVVLPGAADGA